MTPPIAVAAASAGALLICVEFCRPGSVVWGVGGGVLLTVAGYHLAQRGWGWWLVVAMALWALMGVAAYGWLPRAVVWVAAAALAAWGWRVHPLATLPLGVLSAASAWLLLVGARALENKTSGN